MSTQGANAAHLFLSVRQYREYVARGVIPAKATEDEARERYIRHLRAVAAGRKSEEENLDLILERARLARAQTEKTERDIRTRDMDIAERELELVPLADVTATVAAAMQLIVLQDDALAGRLANELAAETNPAVIRKRLLEELRSNRAAAAARVDSWAADSRAAEAAAEPDAG